MALHNETGKKGEQLAVIYLKNKGYRILETNWREQKYELDIVAQIGNELIIVEVKTRRNKFFGDASEAVTPQKQQHLIAGADCYVAQKNIDLDIRFDVICVYVSPRHSAKPVIEHIIDAFGAEW
jgi:putative endonuclease